MNRLDIGSVDFSHTKYTSSTILITETRPKVTLDMFGGINTQAINGELLYEGLDVRLKSRADNRV